MDKELKIIKNFKKYWYWIFLILMVFIGIKSNTNNLYSAAGDYVEVPGSTEITTLGTITTGIWNGTSIENTYLTNSSINFGGVSLSLGESDPTPAFDLSDATGYPTTSLFENAFYIDSECTDQGAADATYTSVKDIVDAIGSSEKATIVFRHDGSGNTTTYTFATTEVITDNFTVIMEPGAIITYGDYDLTIDGIFIAQNEKCFNPDSTGGVYFDSAFNSSDKVREVHAEWWGTLGDGSTDNYAAFRDAINSLNGHGGKVKFGRGAYIIDTGLTLEKGVILEGVGWYHADYGAETDPTNLGGGSWLCIDQNITALTVDDDGVQLRNFAMWFKHDTPGGGWTPDTYGPAIALAAGADDIKIKNILLLNPLKGVSQVDDNGIGRLQIDGLYGQAFSHLIYIQASADILKINNVHQYLYWSNNSNIESYHEANTNIIQVEHDDGGQWSNISGICAKYGIFFDAGAVHDVLHARWNNVYFDGVKHGIGLSADVDASQIDFNNVYINGSSYITGSAITDSVGIQDLGDNDNIKLNNITIQYTGEQGIEVLGTGNRYFIDNIWIEDFNNDAGGHAVMNIGAGNTCLIGSQRIFENGGAGSASPGGAGTIRLDEEGFESWVAQEEATNPSGAGTYNYTGSMAQDGFVCAWIENDGSATIASIELETPSGTPRTKDSIEAPNAVYKGGMCFPVKAADGYDVQVVISAGDAYVYVYELEEGNLPHPYN